jgi:hypothetical protein
MRVLRWLGLAGAVVLCLIAAVSDGLPWALGRPDGYLMVGIDITYIDRYVPELHPVTDFFVNTHTPLLVVALLLAATVGVRGRRARFGAAVAAALATVLSCVNALSRWFAVDPELAPASVAEDRRYAMAFAGLTVVLLAVTALMILRKHLSYDGFVIAFLLLLAGLELVAVSILFISARAADLTPFIAVPGLAHAGAAVAAAAATIGATLSTRPRPAASVPPAGAAGAAFQPFPATAWGGSAPASERSA